MFINNVFIILLNKSSGFWDSYSTVYPLHSIINPDIVGTMMTGWLNAYLEAGWLPTWASPGQRSSMVCNIYLICIGSCYNFLFICRCLQWVMFR